MQIVVYSWWLFNLLEISFLFGFGVLVLFLIIQVFIQIALQKYVEKTMTKKDERLKIIVETFNSIKLLKLYGWEREFRKRVFNFVISN